MEEQQLKGQWKQIKGDLKRRWGELTDDDIAQIEGDYNTLVGKLQERYGQKREEAMRRVNEWLTEAGIVHRPSRTPEDKAGPAGGQAGT